MSIQAITTSVDLICRNNLLPSREKFKHTAIGIAAVKSGNNHGMDFDDFFSSCAVPASSAKQLSAEPRDFELDCALLSLGKLPVILCIGSDRVTGDCLGPLVGQMLVERGAEAFVYGTLSRPITALNLKDAIGHIRKTHAERKILAIDSSVGRHCDVGKIRIAFGSIAPGSADGKNLPKVGDVSITATVTDPNRTPLSAVRLGTVYELAVDITARILRSLQ